MAAFLTEELNRVGMAENAIKTAYLKQQIEKPLFMEKHNDHIRVNILTFS